MDNLRRICVIHDKKDKVPAVHLYEFMNWLGFAYYNYTYNERNDELNDIFKKGDSQFDLIFHINDDSGNWKERFGKYGRINIAVDWKQEQSTDGDSGMVKERYRLLRLWFSVCRELNLKVNSSVRKVLGRSIVLFLRHNLGLMLFNASLNQIDRKSCVPQEYVEGYSYQADVWKEVSESYQLSVLQDGR